MKDPEVSREFEWDKGNLDKSYQKHAITPRESEEIFLDENLRVVPDIKHQEKEPRFAALGKTLEAKVLSVIFTMRGEKIRVISARPANRKERSIYEEKVKKNPKI